MKHLLPLLFLLSIFYPAKATHIVGGEFQLTHQNSNLYQLTLNLYFDKYNGDPRALDQTIWVHIFEKDTNRRVDSVMMSITRRLPVAYTSPACAIGDLSTEKIVYSRAITLDDAKYSSPGGYYLVWERCCRNFVIDNILNPGASGQTFYLEFPALRQNGVRFIDSTPELFPPLSDYACVGELFYYDFGGKDADGDELLYEMVTPINGHQRPGLNSLRPRSAPYPMVNWREGYSTSFQIPGNPTVSITSKTGQLQLRPTQTGLFVFGVRVSEFRNGKKIGEIRRDFQLLVIKCETNKTPSLQVREAGKKSFYKEGDIIKVPTTSRCLDLFLTDTDPDENLRIEAKPINFTLDQPIITFTQGLVNRNGVIDTLKTTACFPTCLASDGKTLLVDFILSDDGCSLPRKDTVRVSFQIEPSLNTPPNITTSVGKTILRPKLGDILSFTVTGTDTDNDQVSLNVSEQNFNLSGHQISFPPISGLGSVTSTFRWAIDCNAVTSPSYILNFTATTINCGRKEITSTQVEIRPDYLNNPPTIQTELANRTIDVLFGTTIADSVFAADINGDVIVLSARGDDFNLSDFGMQFKPDTGNGKARSKFTWTPGCNARKKGQFKVIFSVFETNACQGFPPQLVPVTFNIIYPEVPDFKPANIFTPNNDGKNDYFTLPTLPPNLCESVFRQVKIYNRWGKLVYQDNSREFKWDGKNVIDGVYFYHITYTDKEFKGTVTIVH